MKKQSRRHSDEMKHRIDVFNNFHCADLFVIVSNWYQLLTELPESTKHPLYYYWINFNKSAHPHQTQVKHRSYLNRKIEYKNMCRKRHYILLLSDVAVNRDTKCGFL